MEKELLTLLLQQPDDEKRALKVQYSLTSASQYFTKALGTENCEIGLKSGVAFSNKVKMTGILLRVLILLTKKNIRK